MSFFLRKLTVIAMLIILLGSSRLGSYSSIRIQDASPVPNPSLSSQWLQSAQNLGLSFESVATIYHRVLALYYLGGLGQLVSSNRTLILNYLASSYNGTAGGYGKWPKSEPGIEPTYEAIQVLRVLGNLPTSNAPTIALFIHNLQQGNGGVKDSVSSSFADVGSTYRAIHALLILRGNTNDINLASALTFLGNAQNSDGGFGRTPGNSSQLVFTFRAVYAYNLTSNTPPNLSNIINYIKGLQKSDNGWADVPAGRSSVGHTYDAVHALDILSNLNPGTLDSTTASKATSYLTQSQVALSGFGTHPLGKVPEFLSTHFAAQALQILKRYTSVTFDVNSAIRFSLAGAPLDGGFADVPGGTTDVLDTYYASVALHFLGSSALNGTYALAFLKDSYEPIQGGFGFRPNAGPLVVNTYFGIQGLRFYGAQRNWTAVINFLQSAQNSNGGFGGSPGNASTVMSTAYAALALQILNSAPLNIAGAKNYLLSAHNSNGGFGELPSTPSNTHSTMLAILGLQALGQPLSGVSNALSFLASSRNLDGGYAFNPGNVSRTDFTEDALLTYVAFRTSMPNNSTTKSFLLSLQNADGGFGRQVGSTSEVESSFDVIDALALFAAIASGSWTIDLYAPVIERLLAPAIASPGVLQLSARVIDNESGVASVTLWYSTDARTFTTVTLPSSSGNIYQWSIGPYAVGALITYKITAYDLAGNLGSTTLHTVQIQSFNPALPPGGVVLTGILVAVLAGILSASAAGLAAFRRRRRRQ